MRANHSRYKGVIRQIPYRAEAAQAEYPRYEGSETGDDENPRGWLEPRGFEGHVEPFVQKHLHNHVPRVHGNRTTRWQRLNNANERIGLSDGHIENRVNGGCEKKKDCDIQNSVALEVADIVLSLMVIGERAAIAGEKEEYRAYQVSGVNHLVEDDLSVGCLLGEMMHHNADGQHSAKRLCLLAREEVAVSRFRPPADKGNRGKIGDKNEVKRAHV